MAGLSAPKSGPIVFGSPCHPSLSPRIRAGEPGGRKAGLPAVAPIPAIFLDRDGVINENRHDYVTSWGEFTFLPRVFDALRRLAGVPAAIVVVSNQSAVGRGRLSAAGLEGINQRMVEVIAAQGGRVDAAYYCPHSPSDGCTCRKPRSGMLTLAADERGIDLGRSFLVGDARSDMEAAVAAGCTPVLVLTGRGRSEHALMSAPLRARCHVASDLSEAVEWVLGASTDPPQPDTTSGRPHESC
jgi:D-glycero-D-manno-heptose 1,7-bisphosphate phosphatase